MTPAQKAKLNWPVVLAWLGIAAFWLLLMAAIVWAPLPAQTRFRAEQVLGGLPAPVAAAESQWCPGPVMALESERVLVIGANWSEARPCYAHFNLSPPAGVDPVHVSSFRVPARVTINSSSTAQDEIYVHLSAPAWNGTVMTRPQRIVVTATQPGMLACSGCVIETAAPAQRMFPAFSMPVGMAPVVNGRYHPLLDSILDTKQLYIGANLGIAVRRDGAGVWIELSSVQAQAAQAALQLETARTRAAAAVLESTPPSRRMVETVSSQLADVKQELDQVRSIMPPADHLENATAEAEQARTQAGEIREQVYALEAKMREMETAAYDGVIPGAMCDSTRLGAFEKQIYACTEGRWRRVRTEE